MNTPRANPFSDIENLPTFEPEPKASMPKANDQIEKIAEANGFPSRQAAKPPARARTGRRYKTGRNQQINIKATSQVIERLYKMADARRAPLGELLEQGSTRLKRRGRNREHSREFSYRVSHGRSLDGDLANACIDYLNYERLCKAEVHRLASC